MRWFDGQAWTANSLPAPEPGSAPLPAPTVATTAPHPPPQPAFPERRGDGDDDGASRRGADPAPARRDGHPRARARRPGRVRGRVRGRRTRAAGAGAGRPGAAAVAVRRRVPTGIRAGYGVPRRLTDAVRRRDSAPYGSRAALRARTVRTSRGRTAPARSRGGRPAARCGYAPVAPQQPELPPYAAQPSSPYAAQPDLPPYAAQPTPAARPSATRRLRPATRRRPSGSRPLARPVGVPQAGAGRLPAGRRPAGWHPQAAPTGYPQNPSGPGWQGNGPQWEAPSAPRKSTTKVVLIVLAAVVAGTGLVGILAAIALPVFLDQRAKAAAADLGLDAVTCEQVATYAVQASASGKAQDAGPLAAMTDVSLAQDNRASVRLPSAGRRAVVRAELRRDGHQAGRHDRPGDGQPLHRLRRRSSSSPTPGTE